jgi:hypothetical protein
LPDGKLIYPPRLHGEPIDRIACALLDMQQPSRSRFLRLVGPPGTGKSFLARAIAYRLWTERGHAVETRRGEPFYGYVEMSGGPSSDEFTFRYEYVPDSEHPGDVRLIPAAFVEAMQHGWVVSATVNYATEKATVDYDPDVARPEDLLGAVEAAGYQAVLPAAEPADDGLAEEHVAEDETAALRRRLVISAVLSFPVLLLAMVPALQFDNWQWLSLQLATPVVIWGAWPFHKAAFQNARHATATMDTLISVGVSAAWLWSVYALFLGEAGMPGMRMPFELIPERGAGADHVYLEVAAVVTTLILLGRYFEARAKRRAGAAPRRCSNSAPRTSPSSMRPAARRASPSSSSRSGSGLSCARARRSPPTVSSRRARAPST